jgi:hypothetical protein
MASVLHLHFCWNEKNDNSPKLSEINSKTLSMHSLQMFHCTPCRNFLTQEEKQLKLILSLSLRLQTFNIKSYIHTILKQMHNRENKTTVSIPFNMYK